MDEEKPVWAKQMADSPFTRSYFTLELRQRVLQRIKETRRNRKMYSIVTAMIVPLAAASLVIGLIVNQDKSLPSGIASISESNSGSVERSAYYKQGRLLFTVYPQPDVRAGEVAGYIFHFEDPLETFIGKTLTIQAVHLQSGKQEALTSELITMPNSGYSGLERYTAQFALPLGGMWRFEVLLDGKLYGNVLLSMLDPLWEISPEFQSGTYMMRGLEKQVGFIDAGFIAGRSQKYMWHFWGNNEQLDGPFKVKAVKRDSNEIIEVFSSNALSSANALAGELNGADRHVVTSMLLPEAGRWRLLPYVRGRLLDTIVIDVK